MLAVSTKGLEKMRAKRPNSPALDSRSFRVAGVVTAIFVAAITALVPLLASGEQRFEVSFPSAVHEEALTGRIYVMISRTAEREPRLQIGRTGVPFFGRDVVNLLPGEPGIIDATDLGTPVASLRDIPAGDYYVQAFVNVYSEFRRADGHVIWMHDDRWEGQHWNRSPGNLYSAVERVRLDPEADAVIALSAENAIPPVVVPPDTEWVRRFKFQSSMLTEFWGRPVYLGATVLLPRGYDSSTISYPVNYIQGHFSLNAPNRFQIGDDLYREWIRDDFPRMILVTFQHPNPYFDDSYAVNSVNVGPYGDAILQELIPEIESGSESSRNHTRACFRVVQRADGSHWHYRSSIQIFLVGRGPIVRTQ